MLHRTQLELMSQKMQALRGSALPFGGCCVVMAGDFRQLLCVLPGATKDEVIQASVLASNLWRQVQTTTLSRSLRQVSDAGFAAELLQVGNGAGVQPGQTAPPWVLPPTVTVFNDANKARDWVHDHPLEDCNTASQRCMMAIRNADVLEHNLYFLGKLPTQEDAVELEACEWREPHRPDNSVASFNNVVSGAKMALMEKPGVPPHGMLLKPGALVTCMRNVLPGAAVNGTKLVVERIHKCVLRCRTLEARPQRLFLPRIHFQLTSRRSPVTILRKSFPVVLAYSATINRSQGMTLQKVVLDVRAGPPFAHGMLYVAASRVREARHFGVLVNPSSDATAAVAIPNVVYGELLHAAAAGAPQGTAEPAAAHPAAGDGRSGERAPRSAEPSFQPHRAARAAPSRTDNPAHRPLNPPPAVSAADSLSAAAAAAATPRRRGHRRARSTTPPPAAAAAAAGPGSWRPRARRRLDLAGASAAAASASKDGLDCDGGGAGAAAAGGGGFECDAVVDATVRGKEGIKRAWKQTRSACGNLAFANVLQNHAGPLAEGAVRSVVQSWGRRQPATAMIRDQLAAARVPHENRASDGASVALMALFATATLGTKRVFAATSPSGAAGYKTVHEWLMNTHQVLAQRQARATSASTAALQQRVAQTDRLLLLLPGHWVALRRSAALTTEWYLIDSIGRGLAHANGRVGVMAEQDIDKHGLLPDSTSMHSVVGLLCWVSQPGDDKLLDTLVQRHRHATGATDAAAAEEDEDEEMMD